MNSPLPTSAPAPHRSWTRRLVNLLVALGVIAVAAAAFVFSYDGVHAIALLGGMSSQLARYYPGLFDAVLVIACVAALMLRDGRWWARLWAWIVAIVVLAAIGAADVVHAASFTLAHRTTEGIVAAAPVVAVLLVFSLLLTLLRPYRTVEPEPVLTPLLEVPALPAAAPASPIALPAAPAEAAERAAQDWPGPDAPPTVEYPVFAVAPKVPQAAPAAAHSATTPNEVIVPEAASAPPPAPQARPAAATQPVPEPPTREVPIAAATVPAATVPVAAVPETAGAQAPGKQGEPAPPTVVVPALSLERAAPAPPARAPRGIRYAGGAAPAAAGKQDAAAGDAQAADYWEAADGGQLAGLVYRADQADADQAADGGTADQDGPAHGDGDDGTRDDGPAPGKAPSELGGDAPPFATAPFAAIPRLNRVRSTPIPPADEDE